MRYYENVDTGQTTGAAGASIAGGLDAKIADWLRKYPKHSGLAQTATPGIVVLGLTLVAGSLVSLLGMFLR